jgi:hypothetical protein
VHAKSNEVVEERRQLLENKCEFWVRSGDRRRFNFMWSVGGVKTQVL